MMIIKLLAAVSITTSIGINAVKLNDIKYAAPATYDLRISYYYNASVGYTSLWAYTPSGGGITQEVLFTLDAGYYKSFVSNAFHSSEINWTIWIADTNLNDTLFNHISGTSYRYQSTDGYLSAYSGNGYVLRMFVANLDADYVTFYTVSTYVTKVIHAYNFSTNVYNPFTQTANDTGYHFAASLALNSRIEILETNNVFGSFVDGIYFKLQATANIEGNDYWDIYNQGLNAGYDAGLDAGYDAGLDAGRLENTAWDDAFTIIKGAIDTVGNVMAIQLFGPITIGTLVSIPLIVGLLFWIIDKWRGS